MIPTASPWNSSPRHRELVGASSPTGSRLSLAPYGRRDGVPFVHRLVTGRDDKHDDVTVYIYGTQFPDGHTERNITVHQLHADDPLTVEQARRLAQALIEAADEAKEMNAYGHIVVSENRGNCHVRKVL